MAAAAENDTREGLNAMRQKMLGRPELYSRWPGQQLDRFPYLDTWIHLHVTDIIVDSLPLPLLELLMAAKVAVKLLFGVDRFCELWCQFSRNAERCKCYRDDGTVEHLVRPRIKESVGSHSFYTTKHMRIFPWNEYIYICICIYIYIYIYIDIYTHTHTHVEPAKM
jgi:hypothetical protein